MLLIELVIPLFFHFEISPPRPRIAAQPRKAKQPHRNASSAPHAQSCFLPGEQKALLRFCRATSRKAKPSNIHRRAVSVKMRNGKSKNRGRGAAAKRAVMRLAGGAGWNRQATKAGGGAAVGGSMTAAYTARCISLQRMGHFRKMAFKVRKLLKKCRCLTHTTKHGCHNLKPIGTNSKPNQHCAAVTQQF